MAETVVLGAGISGLTAAITLARKGREVTVLEKEKGIGGPASLNPSIHLTFLQNEAAFWDEVGVGDLSAGLQPLDSLDLRVQGDPYGLGREEMRLVERGPRETSIDARLHRLAVEAGVKFEFGHVVRKIDELPPGSIVAVGHEGPLYEGEKVRTASFYGWSAVGTAPEGEHSMFVYMDDYATDALYGGACCGLWYGLVYSMRPVKKEDLPRCEEILEREAGVKGVKWRPFRALTPVGRILRPELRHKGRILAGAFAGDNDPLSGLGINAAFLSGRAAAMAVERPEAAEKFFRRHFRHHAPLVAARMALSFVPAPLRLAGMKRGLERPGAQDGLRSALARTLPGYAL